MRTPVKKFDRKVSRRNQKGSTILETSLILLTLIGMILFIMDMGRILMLQEYIIERTRVAARAAVVNNWSATQAQNYLVYNSTTGSGAGFMGLLPSQVTYRMLGTSGASDYRLQMKVSGVPVSTWIPMISGKWTLATVIETVPAQSMGATN